MNGRRENGDCHRKIIRVILIGVVILSGFSCSHVRKIERTPENIEKLKKDLTNKKQAIEFVDGTKKTVKDIEIDSDSVRWVNIKYRGIGYTDFQVLDKQKDEIANVKAISYVDYKQGASDAVKTFAVPGTLVGHFYYLYDFEVSSFPVDAAKL